jgi:broad specificity phosphatase PhoE
MFGLPYTLRHLALAFLLVAATALPALALSRTSVTALTSGGHVILMRHAQTVSGVGDPQGFQLGDCTTQRNLSEAGRQDSRRFGEALRQNGIAVDRVLSSPWCRCVDTAKLALPDKDAEVDTSLSSFFNVRGEVERQDALEKMRATIASWKGPGNLLMVSHQQTIAALAGESLSQGAVLILKPKPGGFDVIAEDKP